MPAKSPEENCSLFQQYMAEGDIDSVLSIYDPEAVILDKSGEVKKGEEGLRQNLAPFALWRRRPFRLHCQDILSRLATSR